MPLYEYQCDACGGRLERIRKFSDPPLDEPCPSCGGHLTKLISAPGIKFKGAGWYVNDYGKSGSAGSAKSGASDSKDAKDSKSESKSEGGTATPSPAPAKTND